MKFDLAHLILIGVAAYFAFLSQCGPGSKCPELVASDTTFLPGDTVLTEIEVDRPYPVYRERVIPGRIDTVKIIEEFFTRYFYSDTIMEDSNFIAVINDTLFGNQIISRKFFHQNLRQTAVIINNTLLNPPRLKLFVGGFVSGNMTAGLGAGGSLHLLTKKDLLFNYGFDALQMRHQAGVAFKVRLRK